MPKHSARNLALALSILAPCARAANATAKPQIIVQSIQRGTLTPRDVAEGFDSRFDVVLNYKGTRPKNWGKAVVIWATGNPMLTQKQSQGWKYLRNIASPQDFEWRVPTFDKASQTYKASFLFHLSKIAPQPKPIRFESRVENSYVDGELLTRLAPPLSIAFDLLKAGEKAAPPPQVSREVPISLVSAQLVPAPMKGHPDDLFTVRLRLKRLRPVPASKVSLNFVGPIRLLAPTGHAYIVRNGYGYGPPQGEFINLDYYIKREQLPKTRQFRFQTRLSMNESWPLEIRTIVKKDEAPKG